jgi:hypothetical protein
MKSTTILVIALWVLSGCDPIHNSVTCKDWDALDHQALVATLGLSCNSFTDCGRLDQDQSSISNYQKAVDKAKLTGCERAAYEGWLSYYQSELDSWCRPECDRRDRINNSTAVLPPV